MPRNEGRAPDGESRSERNLPRRAATGDIDAASVSLRVLGAPALARRGQPKHVPTKALAVLAVLALERQGQTKATLAALLWPDSAQARANLRKALMHLRRELGDDPVVVTRDDVRLGSEVRVDAVQFSKGYHMYAGHHPGREPACDACLSALESVADLWHGSFMEGFTLVDSEEFDTWQAAVASQLQSERRGLLLALVGAYAARGAWDAADERAAALVEHAPLDEAAYRARMRVLVWAGRRAEALDLFGAMSERLTDELGAEPSARSAALRVAIAQDRLPPPVAPPPSIQRRAWVDRRLDERAPSDSGERPGQSAPSRSGGSSDPADSHHARAADPSPTAGSGAVADLRRADRRGAGAAARLLAALRAGDDAVELTHAALTEIAAMPVENLAACRLAQAATWLAPPHALHRRFVPVSLVRAAGARRTVRSAQATWADLESALGELDAPAAVVLGGPGAGKSTMLRHMQLSFAIRGLAGDRAPMTFFVALSRFPVPIGREHDSGAKPTKSSPSRHSGPAAQAASDQARDSNATSPYAWLRDEWRRRFPALPPLEQVAAETGLLLLLDGLDEAPRPRGTPPRRALKVWREFVRADLPSIDGLRAVFTCRHLDYALPLSGSDVRVPQLYAQLLSSGGMASFIASHLPEMEPDVRDVLCGRLFRSPAAALYRTPYLLELLTDQIAVLGALPTDTPALITGFVRRVLQREVERGHPALDVAAVLAEGDVRQIVHDAWRGAYDLPERGALARALEGLAEAAIETGEPQASTPDLDPGVLRARYGDEVGVALARAALGLGVLTEVMASDDLRFTHRLFQDYFAGRCMARRPALERVAEQWRADRIEPPLGELVAELQTDEMLPELPVSGWQDATILAAAMADDPDAFALRLADANTVLAGRAVAAAPNRFAPGVHDALRVRLLERAGDPAAELRARIAAGDVLGALGRLPDAGFEMREGTGGALVLPPMLAISDGEHGIGSDSAAPDEAPRHPVRLEAFEIALYPVTNLEFGRFIAAGGYEDDAHWDTAAGRAWRAGVDTGAGPKASARQWTEQFRRDPAKLESLYADGHMSRDWFAVFQRRIAMTSYELEAHLEEMYPGGPIREPAYRSDPRFSGPSQPVVGISWYEARAYAAWLSAQTGRPFRLPTEAEWEAACTAAAPVSEPGNSAAFALNTSDTHLWRPTPIGVFEPCAGRSRTAVADALGNVWEWTSSLYGREASMPEFPYPYRPDDGREDAEATADVRRVARGGAWDSPRSLARCSVRDAVLPGGRDQAYGMRLACG